ncbi:MAG: sulfatase family protein [Anaerolineae bacterium]
MKQRPNILWLMTDEQRADSVGYDGAPWAHTPSLDRLAADGVRFQNAYTPSPVCVSARACMLTGKAGSSIGMMNNHHWLGQEGPDFLTWRFAAAGYQVASFGKHHYHCDRQAFDYEGGQTLGNRVHYFGYQTPVDAHGAGVVRYNGGPFPWLFAGRFPGGVEATPEMENVADALQWVRRRDPARPYFLRLSFNAPHTPVVTPAPFDTMISQDAIDLPIDRPDAEGEDGFVSSTHRDHLFAYAGTDRLTDVQIRRARQCYYGYVACVDHAFGRLIEELGEMGELENTIVAYVADHGTHLGDHGFFQKQSFWDAAARVPFFLAGPGIEQREDAVHTPVNVGSLLPTLLDLVGLEVPAEVQYPSLGPMLADGSLLVTGPVFSELDYGVWRYRTGDRYVMIRDGRWKLSLYRDPGVAGQQASGRPEDRVLFDLEADPGERQNLADDVASRGVVDSLIAKIDAWDDSRPIGKPLVQERLQHSRTQDF